MRSLQNPAANYRRVLAMDAPMRTPLPDCRTRIARFHDAASLTTRIVQLPGSTGMNSTEID